MVAEKRRLVKAGDLIEMPKAINNTSKRRPTNKLPGWHLTSQKSMEFIKEAHERKVANEAKKQKKEDITKQALKEAAKKEREAKKKRGPRK